MYGMESEENVCPGGLIGWLGKEYSEKTCSSECASKFDGSKIQSQVSNQYSISCCRVDKPDRLLESAKVALAMAMQECESTNVALADRLGVTELIVRRMLDLDHRNHIGQIKRALHELGKRLEVSVKAA